MIIERRSSAPAIIDYLIKKLCLMILIPLLVYITPLYKIKKKILNYIKKSLKQELMMKVYLKSTKKQLVLRQARVALPLALAYIVQRY